MELINATKMEAACTLGVEPSGRESLIVAVKGTFRIPAPTEAPDTFSMHETQVPLVMGDTFTGDPGRSSPVLEADFAPHKGQCDVLLVATAHAPGGRPVQRVDAGIRIGQWSKRIAVLGRRHWNVIGAGIEPSAPEPFVRQAITYDVAFGGLDQHHKDPQQHEAYGPNPIGRGFHRHLRGEWVEGAPMPMTEAWDEAILAPDGAYRPMSFGPIGRGWDSRRRHAGTYDDAWLANHYPFLPPDFDAQYFQAAPDDQQIPLAVFKSGPLEVLLGNLTPEGRTRFAIPPTVAPIHVFPKKGPAERYEATLDTIVIEPDEQRFCLTWRLSRPLRRDLFEIAEVLVGQRARVWWIARETLTMPGSRSALELQSAEDAL